jgi:DDE superfamily endonuclease
MTVFRQCGLVIDGRIKKKADLAYAGLEKQVEHFRIPVKKPKGGELTKKQKRKNRRFRSQRVKVEHTIRKWRMWRIVKETYRNKLRHIGQVRLIVCGLVNFSSS